ncbi:hybrid sensor histidine kinase/response regulator [Piscinibacter koreensis]|uniref:histidine kinase n=1 Tax=Piscinibacter koreensis TaxID=2742824 RepID=A0A7Y6TYQ6_9BURK|nr:PAS domain S-box protein [Schlegelella koreensis]NUZ08331.1 PAS domain S-box protein [Schlegelella koreensis]
MTSLKFTVPLILLLFAAVLSAVNLLVHVPQAEQVAQEDSRKRLAQELSRLQSTLEYLLLKGDAPSAQYEIAVLAHNHDVIVAVLTDEHDRVTTATRRAWLGRPIAEVLPQIGLGQVLGALSERRAGIETGPGGRSLLGHAAILLGSRGEELRPSRSGSLLVAYDLVRYKAEAREQVMRQALYWAGWVTALALVMWAVFHFLLTRRTARLMRAAEALAAGRLDVRSGLSGDDELGRLGRAFDAMAVQVAETQTRLRDDLAERARVQRELEASDERLQQILNNSTAVIFARDAEGRYLFVNRQWERVFGLRSADVVGRLDAEVRGAERAAAYRAHDRQVLERNETLEFEEAVPLDDGVHTYISIKFPLHDADGAAYAVCGIATDITERQRADAALRASEASYRAIFDAAEDAIFVHDIDTASIVDVNAKACADFGYPREAMLRLRLGDLSAGEPPYTHEGAMRHFARAAAGEPMSIDWHCRTASGELRWHEVHGKRVTIAGRDRLLTLARDITEKKRAQAELARERESSYQREKLAALGSLLAGVSHELNNPLSVVVARAVLLEEQGSPSIRTAAAKIRSAAERCARIVRTFLAMARQQPPQRGPVAINEVIGAALDIAGYAVRASGITLELALADDVPAIHADADQLHQVLLNLVINAQQSLQDHAGSRRIRIESRFDAARARVLVRVADSGPGIPEALRARVFEPYFTTKAVGTGTGVGLAVSQGIVEAHGGSLTIEAPDGAGAAFLITLPLGDAAGERSSAPSLTREDAGARSILIVDDEEEVRETLVDILSQARHRVVTAATGREALARMAAERYDVIFADMRMPDLDGRALYREIERRWPAQAARVVFITGDMLTASLRDFVGASGRHLIEKPFLPGDVRRLVVELAA